MSPLQENEFEEVALEIEKRFPNFDFDQEDGKITVYTNKGILLINWHGIAQEIWVSSPITGAHHFFYSEAKWKNTRTKVIFKEQIIQELNTLNN